MRASFFSRIGVCLLSQVSGKGSAGCPGPDGLGAGRSAWLAGLALVAGLFSTSALRADSIRGQVTRCGEPVTGMTVRAFVSVEVGFKTDLKPCVKTTSTVPVGQASLDAAGRYSLTFARPVPDEDVCSFILKGAFVELRAGGSGALVWRSPTRAFSGATTAFVFDHAIECPPPPPPGGDPMTVSGSLLLCGQPAAGFQVTAVTEVRVGFDLSDTGGKPCQLSSPQYAVGGRTTVASDGRFSIRFDRPINPSPEDSCSFVAKVFIKLFDPSTGAFLWFSSSKPIATSVVFDEDICRFFVAVSVKVMLDSAGRRPSGGHYSTDAQIERAISQANTVLAINGVGWRLFLDEIVDVEQPQYFRLGDRDKLRALERDAKADPDAFLWRDDAVNFYVVDELVGAGGSVGGTCSFPPHDEIIAINNRGILNGGVGWLHEVGHFLSLLHTFECLGAECSEGACTQRGAIHGGAVTTIVDCPDNCPHDHNVMSYNSFDVSDAVFGACQIREMSFELFDPAGSRAHVLRRVLPTGVALPRILPDLPAFLRGDSNSSGKVDISDALNTLGVLILGSGAIDCPDAADANDDGQLDISDAVATLGSLFLGIDRIAPPGALTCSPDGTEDELANCAYNEASCPVSNGKS